MFGIGIRFFFLSVFIGVFTLLVGLGGYVASVTFPAFLSWMTHFTGYYDILISAMADALEFIPFLNEFTYPFKVIGGVISIFAITSVALFILSIVLGQSFNSPVKDSRP